MSWLGDLARERRMLVLGAACLLAAALTVAAVLAVRSLPEQVRDGDTVARERAALLAQQLDEDLEVALRSLPGWAVARLDADAEQLPATGTIAVKGPTTCVGVQVTIDGQWVLHGQQDGVTVSEVTELDDHACARD